MNTFKDLDVKSTNTIEATVEVGTIISMDVNVLPVVFMDETDYSLPNEVPSNFRNCFWTTGAFFV